MATKAKPNKKIEKGNSFRRRTWGLRMAGWSVLLIGMVAVIACSVSGGWGNTG